MLYRCTRRWPYSGNCSGQTNVGSRQGYYKEAINHNLALAEMAKLFPEDIKAGYWFDIQYWDNSKKHGQIITQDGERASC